MIHLPPRRWYEYLAFLLALSCALCPRAAAQSYNYYNQIITNNMATSQLSQSIFNDMMAGELTREALKSSAHRPKGGSTASQPTTFRPVAASLMPQRLASGLAKTPTEQQELERLYGLLLEDYREIVRRKGVAPNDVARATSFVIASSYGVLKDQPPVSEAQLDALRAQMREVLTGSARFQRLTDRQKQELFEGYAILGMYLNAGYDGAIRQGDRKVLSQMREMARKQLEGMFGVPAGRLRLTAQGIEF